LIVRRSPARAKPVHVPTISLPVAALIVRRLSRRYGAALPPDDQHVVERADHPGRNVRQIRQVQ
jgi:hypothetical protein